MKQKQAIPSLTIVVPVLNEAESIGELHERLRVALPPDTEIIFVDDGSSDSTYATLKELLGRDPLVRIARFRRNFGKSAALSVGFRYACGRRVAMLDGDLQDRPEDVLRLLAKLDEGYDLVGGWRRQRRDRTFKVWGSWVFNWLVSRLSGLRVRDINCGLKVMRREVIDDLRLSVGFHRFIPLLAHWRGFRVAELEVEHDSRRHGQSRYGGERVLGALLDLVVILFLVRYRGRPGRYFVALGSVLGLIGFSISAHLAAIWFAYGSVQSKFPRLALGLVLIVVGVQLVSMGLFGELLAYHFRARGTEEPAASFEGGLRRSRRARRPRRRSHDRVGGGAGGTA